MNKEVTTKSDLEKMADLKQWRKTNNLTQKQAADRLAIANRQTVGRFEKGERRIPDRIFQTINEGNNNE